MKSAYASAVLEADNYLAIYEKVRVEFDIAKMKYELSCNKVIKEKKKLLESENAV